jgi:formate hydrogenlyase transcriptional activator
MDPSMLGRLLDASAALGPCRDLGSLGRALFQVLRWDLPVDRLALWLGDEEEGGEPEQWAAKREPDGLLSLVEPLPEWVAHTRDFQDQVWSLEEALERGCHHPFVPRLAESGYPAWVLIPLRTPERLVGGLSLASFSRGAFQDAISSRFPHLARFLASFALRILRLRQLDRLNEQLAQERDQQRSLLEFTNELAVHRDPRDLFQAIASGLRQHFHTDVVSLVLMEDGRARVRFLDFPSSRGHLQENQVLEMEESPSQRAMALRLPQVFGPEDLETFPHPIPQRFRAEGILSLCVIPLTSRNRVMGTLNFGSRQAGAFTQATLGLLSQVTAQVAMALDNAFAYQEIQALRDRLARENLYLHEEMEKDFGTEMVGRGAAFQKALRQVETVAGSDATVLILGETGTGKELVARAIHHLSPRKDQAFVQVNCASLPAGLVESELFGHEKGAFTGALTAKAGRLELAHQGTLFLDEVGDLALELQPKLLRALQERQFERLGGTRTLQVDLRLVAATNRDLQAMVGERSFRADLFYRLNVFPIQLPPLRERKEDIPLLARYFTQKFAQRLHRPIETIPARAMEALLAWPWPGNIRELENVIERSVLLSRGPELQVPVAELQGDPLLPSPSPAALPTLEEAQREHIRKALRDARGKVGGPDGAAARLGLKRTTLQSRMRKLGMDPREV